MNSLTCSSGHESALISFKHRTNDRTGSYRLIPKGCRLVATGGAPRNPWTGIQEEKTRPLGAEENSRIEPPNLVGTARCAVRAAFSGATWGVIERALVHSFRPLHAGGDITARCPYRNQGQGEVRSGQTHIKDCLSFFAGVHSRGYTLVELLCVIGIIGVLAGLYLGAIARAFLHITKFLHHF